MYKSEDGMPSPLAGESLADLLEIGGSNERTIIAQIGSNMGSRTFLFSLPMKVFYDQSIVANERGDDGEQDAQRPLNLAHATKMAVYMLKGVVSAAILRRNLTKQPASPGLTELAHILGTPPYVSMQPVVCNLRTVDPTLQSIRAERLEVPETKETIGFKVWLSQEDLFYVVDGQHRRKAMQILFEFLSNAIQLRKLTARGNLLKPVKGELDDEIVNALGEVLETASGFTTIQVECHLGLGIEEERQLFHDLNNLGKKVETSLALKFDSANPINIFIKEALIDDDEILDWEIVEKDVTDWKEDEGAISRKDLVSVNARLFHNKTNLNGANPLLVEERQDQVSAFWRQIVDIAGIGKPGAKLNTVAAQPVMLKALAKLFFDFTFGSGKDEDLSQRLLDGIQKVDFSHENMMWRYYQLTESERKQAGLSGLSNYLPSDDEGFNRDIGNYDSNAKTMRFGAKHNDIFPILGDMIRYKLDLPSRHKK